MLQCVCSPKQTGIPQETCRYILKTKKSNLSSVNFSVHYGSILCFSHAVKVYLDLIKMSQK